MAQQVYPDFHGRTLDDLFQERLAAGETPTTALANLTKLLQQKWRDPEGAVLPLVEITPAPLAAWRLIHSERVLMLFPDGAIVPGTDIRVHAVDSVMWRGKRSPVTHDGQPILVISTARRIPVTAWGPASVEFTKEQAKAVETETAAGSRRRRDQGSPQQTRARKVLDALYSDGYPTQEQMSNTDLLDAFVKKYEEMKKGQLQSTLPRPGASTVLRAAGRK